LSWDKIDKLVSTEAVTIPQLVKYSSTAGVGRFIGDCSTTNVAFVDIAVDQWWTTDPGTNTVRFYKIAKREEHWTFPTNVPVVFFGMTKGELYGDLAERALETSGEDGKDLTFSVQERSWFRVMRDNGLLHTFATNLWDCARTNPDEIRFFNVLRDAERDISMEDSWRMMLDTKSALSVLLATAPEALLAQKIADPLISPTLYNDIGNYLFDRFDWTFTIENGVRKWHPPE